MNEDALQTLARDVGKQLLDKKLMMATAESCSGGWVSKIVTDIDGSSQWFECALITYSNRAKQNLLGVSDNTLEKYGAVSQSTVEEMVLGLLVRCKVDIGVSISGIAGPGGGTQDKPVGTVWMAWANSQQLKETIKFQFEGDRSQVRQQAVYEALLGVLRNIE